MNVTPAARHDGHLLVVEKHHVARVLEDGRDVGRDEPLALADADHDRRAVAHGDDLLGVVGATATRSRTGRAGAASPAAPRCSRPSSFHSCSTRCATTSVSVSVTNLWPCAAVALQLEVVLDDAVVNDHDAAGAVAMRVRVLFGGPAVRGPAGVAEAVERRSSGVVGNDVLEIGELAGAAPQSMRRAVDDRHARGVVAAIFEPPQSLDEDGDDGLVADVSDDAAHRMMLSVPVTVQFKHQLQRFSGALCLSNFHLELELSVLRFSTQPACFPGGRARCRARRPARRR